MSKYQINYGRKLPEHRLPFDYLFEQKIKSPFEYFKVSYLLYSTISKDLIPLG